MMQTQTPETGPAPSTAPPHVRQPFLPEPNEFYPEEFLVAKRFFTFNQLRKARYQGRLRSREIIKGNRHYKGSWLIAWLEGKPVPADN
ncbi:MAG: hypothetical protein JO270_19450 [Acidobacteriaceae bacterium]|nr:hypothetical protein [Acidobacteriaceae bacterium]